VGNTASKERKTVHSSQGEKSPHQKGKAGSIIMTGKQNTECRLFFFRKGI